MLSLAFAIASKDLKLTFARAAGLCQAILLGLLLIFIFSLSSPPGEIASPQAAAAIFWLGTAFCQILIFNQLYAIEEVNSVRESLILAPGPAQGIWLGKALAGLLLLLVCQIILLPAALIFLSQHFAQSPGWGLAMLFSADLGMAALGSLLGAVGQGQAGRESLLSIVLFPLMLPVLLAAISLSSQCLGGVADGSPQTWLGLTFAFDAIFCAAGLGLFGFLYGGGE